MRRLILIAAIGLACTTAHAGQPRSLSLAAADPAEPVAEQPRPQTADTAKLAPSTVAAPAPATTAATATTCGPVTTTQTPAVAPTYEPAKAAAPPAPSTTNTAISNKSQESTRPAPRKTSIETRVVRELHRHGIYW